MARMVPPDVTLKGTCEEEKFFGHMASLESTGFLRVLGPGFLGPKQSQFESRLQ